MVDTNKCPCGSSENYRDCCGPLHTGQEFARTAEQLMRSRYSAYVKRLKDYLLDTWHVENRPKAEDLNLDDKDFRWVTLKIVDSENGQEADDQGIVEFIATYTYQGNRGEMRERSSFVKLEDRWFYTAC